MKSNYHQVSSLIDIFVTNYFLFGRASPSRRGITLDAIKYTCRGSLSRDRGINALSCEALTLIPLQKPHLV